MKVPQLPIAAALLAALVLPASALEVKAPVAIATCGLGATDFTTPSMAT